MILAAPIRAGQSPGHHDWFRDGLATCQRPDDAESFFLQLSESLTGSCLIRRKENVRLDAVDLVWTWSARMKPVPWKRAV